MPNGYWNKVLRVNLTSGDITTDLVTEENWRFCLGGAGYGAKVLLEETTAETDPFSPDNPIIFALGPYQAENTPGNAKWTVVSKSPLTGTFGDSAAGADWGMQLKKAGYDALIVTGAAKRPVYLVINDEQMEIKDAATLWGQDAYDTFHAIRKLEVDDISVACIGPAGEKLVRFACIVADAHSFAGRCGLGAVMGSKMLKAIAVRGTKKVPVYDSQGCRELSKQRLKEIFAASKDGLRKHGTPDLCILAESFGDMPIKNWAGDVWPEGAAKLGAPNYTDVLKAKPQSCVNCPIGCHRDIEIADKSYSVKGPGPEYETLGMLGSNLLIDDVKAVAKANDICNRLGIDTISAGACIGLAMECYEKGYLSGKKTGLDLSWGNSEAMIDLLTQIGNRTGFGTIFADGTLKAAEEIHPDARQFVTHVKGLDLPAHDARACWSLGINYATSTRGACHMRGVTEDVEMGGFFVPELGIVEGWSEFFQEENKSELAVKFQDLCAWLNSAVICVFMLDGGGLSLTNLAEMFNSVTGWNWSIADIMQSGERILNLQRLINIRDGHSRKTDALPPRMYQPAKEGFRADQIPAPLDGYLDKYYQLRQWNSNGVPTRECLNRLGLGQYAEIIESVE